MLGRSIRNKILPDVSTYTVSCLNCYLYSRPIQPGVGTQLELRACRVNNAVQITYKTTVSTIEINTTQSKKIQPCNRLIRKPQKSNGKTPTKCRHTNLWGRKAISDSNRTKWSSIRSVIIRVIDKIGRPRNGSPILTASIITDRIGRHEVLLPINYNHYNFRENKCIPFSLSNITNSSILENPQFGKIMCEARWLHG